MDPRDVTTRSRGITWRRPTIATGFLLGLIGLLAGCDGQRISAENRGGSAADSSEHVMFNGRTIITANGVRRGEVSGDTVASYDAVTRFRFRRLTVRLTTALGRPLAVVTAPEGEYSLATGTVVATGPVTVVSDTTARRIVTAAVRYDVAQNQLAGDSAFTATSGARTMSGVGFTADPGLFTIRCLKDCKGSLGR